LAAQALDSGESPLLNALLAARAAHEQRDFKARDAYLARAERQGAHGDAARLMTQVELLLDARDLQPALGLLKQLKETAPKHTGVLRLDLKAQQQARNWDGVLAAVAQLEKREAIEPVQAEQLRVNAHIENLKRKAHLADELKTYWEKMPAGDRINGKIATMAARLFLGMGGTKQARDIIEQSLEKHWDSSLVELYGQCADKDAVKQIERAEKWLQSHSKDPALLLALGRLCARQELWGKAQSYIEASLAVESTRTAHLALAQLLEKMNKVDEACKHYRESLALESAG
jgi:HemY protein